MKHIFFLGLIFGPAIILSAQPSVCVTSAVPSHMRAEGITERIGDIIYTCTGVPNKSVTVNLSISLNTNITNRISSGNALTGIVLTTENGSGPQPIPGQPLLNGPNTVFFNGVTLTLSPQGAFSLRIAGIRANAIRIPADTAVFAFLGGDLNITTSQLTAGVPERGLYVAYSSRIVCAQYGSPLPDVIGFTNLVTSKTFFATTRVTEGRADAFNPRSAPANFNADSGDRIIVRYSGLPADARLFVPDVVAGSDAVQPTAGGDFGPPASGGAYVPSANASLLLARVAGAMANGGGGNPVFVPGPMGSAAVAFDSVSELGIVNGSAYVVYEVVDANPFAVETAQFPTFLGLPFNGSRTPSVTSEEVFLAPVSSVMNASSTEPLPRFAAITPQPDCGIIGDCATYLPHLVVNPASFQFTSSAGSATQQAYFTVSNTGGGSMPWSASVAYANGTGWLSLDPNSAPDAANVRIYAIPGSLAPGTYNASVTIDAGPFAGTRTIPVTFVVTAAPPAPPLPTITSVLNAASLDPVPVVPGSLTTIMGSAFIGKNVSVTFDALPATTIFNNATQINVVVPSELAAKTSAQLIVTVDGLSSVARTVAIAPFEPAVFKGAILNEDSTVNDSTHGAHPGSVISLWATGLSGNGTITGHIHDREIAFPEYAGPAPGLPGVQQINLLIPSDLPAMTTDLYVCGTSPSGDTKTCSIPVPLTLN
jgi:uncharacterized protein (TIGR03437 family)